MIDESELQGESDDELLAVSSVRWAGGNKIVYRDKWTRIRPGFYARLIGTNFFEVEKCSSDWCPSDYRGWGVRQRRIGGWREELWETTYSSAKQAQAAAEKVGLPQLVHPSPNLEDVSPEDLARANFDSTVDIGTFGALHEAWENVSDTALVDDKRGPYWEAATNAFDKLAVERLGKDWWDKDYDESLPDLRKKRLKARLLR